MPAQIAIVAGTIITAWLAWTINTVAAEPKPSLDELLKQYQALGLPLPPKAAKLVSYDSGTVGTVNGELQPRVYELFFVIKPATATDRPVFLSGTAEWQERFKGSRSREVRPEPLAVENHSLGDKLVFAIQCHSLGWRDLAEKLLELSQEDSHHSPGDQLVTTAWRYWTQQLTKPMVDRAPALSLGLKPFRLSSNTSTTIV